MTVTGPPDDYTDKLKAAMVGVFGGDARSVEIRHNDDGVTIDEIIAHGCTVHIEQMSLCEWWMEIAAADGSFWHFWFGAKNGRSHVDVRCTETISAEEAKA